jgi:hypothetical protein
MQKTKFWVGTILILFIVWVFIQQSEVVEGESIKIGAVLSLTGVAAEFGDMASSRLILR